MAFQIMGCLSKRLNLPVRTVASIMAIRVAQIFPLLDKMQSLSKLCSECTDTNCVRLSRSFMLPVRGENLPKAKCHMVWRTVIVRA
jgi:hypothetical protein